MFFADNRITGRETYNTAVGYEALKGGANATNNFGQYNTAIGDQSLFSNTSGNYNTAIGVESLYSNTTGDGNTANGVLALFENTTGSDNTANGWQALYYNRGNNRSTAIGKYAMYYADNRVTGRITCNTAIGYEALRGSSVPSNNTGLFNTAIGDQSLGSNTSGNYNTGIGVASVYFNSSGSGNTAVGSTTLFTNLTGSYNTVLGYRADVTSNNLTNATAIGYNAEVSCDNCMSLGNTDSPVVKVGVGTSSPRIQFHASNATSNLSTSLSDFGTGIAITASTPRPRFYFEHTAGAVNNKVIFMEMNNGELSFSSTNDNASAFEQQNILVVKSNGNVGVKRVPSTNRFEVEGNASKSSSGDWLANSDARLKKNISPLNSQKMLEKLLSLQGITYEWNDDETGSTRPDGIQYGFTAQNIQSVFPTLVEEDNLGYLQTGYGTYDAMTIEAIRALHDEIKELKKENETLKQSHSEQMETLLSEFAELKDQINLSAQAYKE